ncbi:MAG: hypothetical protein Kow0047_26240 [Anaerolineae bacterium]
MHLSRADKAIGIGAHRLAEAAVILRHPLRRVPARRREVQRGERPLADAAEARAYRMNETRHAREVLELVERYAVYSASHHVAASLFGAPETPIM